MTYNFYYTSPPPPLPTYPPQAGPKFARPSLPPVSSTHASPFHPQTIITIRTTVSLGIPSVTGRITYRCAVCLPVAGRAAVAASRAPVPPLTLPSEERRSTRRPASEMMSRAAGGSQRSPRENTGSELPGRDGVLVQKHQMIEDTEIE